MKKTVFIALIFIYIPSFSQQVEWAKPPHWFTDMKYHEIELILKGKNLSKANFYIKDTQVHLKHVTHEKNPNYAYLTLDLKNVKTGILDIHYTLEGKKYTFPYKIKPKREHSEGIQGLNPSDLIYLITPDRFSNGDESNDAFVNMEEKTINRDSIVTRHGGDIRGVINHLDYIKELGVTATWLNPIEENNQDFQSYHGYGITNFFLIDKRFGTMEEYQEYVDKSHEKGLKVIKDVVYNHPGKGHWASLEAPDPSWFNNQEVTNYRVTAKFDPYASKYDRNKVSNGWFDIPGMPDFNQNNPHVATYLTQYSLWWIEEFGIDAYRVDTFAYPDQNFMWKMMDIIKHEYPNFTIFGEVWATGEATQSYYSKNRKGTQEHIKNVGISDFELQYAMMDTCNEEFGWNTGIAKIYYTLSWDWLYDNPMKNVIFMGNHDIERFHHSIKNDLNCNKMMTAFTLTTRGIPQLYYGDEILFDYTGHHGEIRADFPGGWKEDATNKFKSTGRTSEENDYFNHLKTLAHWRKKNPDIVSGKLIQFIPEDHVYVYFRIAKTTGKTIMVLLNSHKENSKKVDTNRFKELLFKFKTGTDVISKKSFNINDEITLLPKTALILELE
ncbi:MAG: alpha-amylase family glycosyl hydrolase [Flavobacteriales bacterium]